MHKYFSTGQYKNIIKHVNDRATQAKVPVPELEFKGTVKLHGTNASIYNVLSNDELVIQSKNNIITVEEDNNGFARFVSQHKAPVDAIFAEIKAQYPEQINDKTAVIYGEWCGGNIQPNVALNQLEKMFVIFAIKLIDNKSDLALEDEEPNETWLTHDEIHLVLSKVDKLNDNKIYNIFDFPTFEIKIDMSNPKLTQNTLVELTNAVEKECPVAKQFGISGLGEGIVWKCVSVHPHIKTSDLVFKVKGKEHSVTHVKELAEVDTAKVNSIKEFVDTVVTDNRLKQGIDYLNEMHVTVEPSNMGVFLKWVANDCLKEESDVIEASGLERKEVMPAINNKAKQFFFKCIQQNAQSKEK